MSSGGLGDTLSGCNKTLGELKDLINEYCRAGGACCNKTLGELKEFLSGHLLDKITVENPRRSQLSPYLLEYFSKDGLLSKIMGVIYPQ